MQINTQKNAFNALFYLVFIIVSQQWKTLIALIVFTLIIIPLPKVFVANGGYETTPNGLIGLFYTLPVLLITLVYLPMVHNQVYSSSIKKRLNASGVPPTIYALTMILLFAAIALVVFYSLGIVAWLIWNGATYIEINQTPPETTFIWSANTVNWLSLLLLSPIAIIGLSSTGLLIGRIRISEIIKGLTIFFFILITVLMSRTIFNPLLSDMALSDYDSTKLNENAIFLSKVFIVNPWGSMLYTLQDSYDHILHGVVGSGLEHADMWEGAWSGQTLTLVWSTLSSILISSAAIFTHK